MKKIFKRFRPILLSLFCGALVVSCGTSSVMAVYDVSLSSVESPENAKEQFGGTKIVKLTESQGEESINKYQYEDQYIQITWLYATNQLDFELVNKSDYTLKINWDNVSYMDYNGNVSRIMHKGVKYNNREESQGTISIPKGGRLNDMLVPTSNVYFDKGFGMYVPAKWVQTALFPCYYKKKSDMKADIARGTWLGRTIKVLFPIEIEGVKNDYSFEFRVDGVLNE